MTSETYPDALGRLWSALRCPHSGDVLVSASAGYEFVDWGGADHVGGGSHGSLHRDDSEGVLLHVRGRPPDREQWSLTDVTPLVLEHFGVPSAAVTEEARTAVADRATCRPRACARRPRRPHNWLQLVKFCAVGASGYVVNLACSRCAWSRSTAHHLVAATAAFVVAVTNNFWWNRHWTFRAAKRPRRLPGRALLHGQRGGVPVRGRRARAARERGRRGRGAWPRRSRSSPRPRSTSSGTRCGASASSSRATERSPRLLAAAACCSPRRCPRAAAAADLRAAGVGDRAAALLRAQRARGERIARAPTRCAEAGATGARPEGLHEGAAAAGR